MLSGDWPEIGRCGRDPERRCTATVFVTPTSLGQVRRDKGIFKYIEIKTKLLCKLVLSLIMLNHSCVN